MLALATTSAWPIHQLDVSNAFLHGFLDSQIYMDQPPGFVNTNFSHHVCQLHKSLYGLKQTPRAWFQWLSDHLVYLGFQPSKADTSLFTRINGMSKLFVLIYVDDILVTRTTKYAITWFIDALKAEFLVHDMGSIHYFLGMEAKFIPHGLILTQQWYINDLLVQTNMSSCKPYNTPMATSPPPIKIGGSIFINGELYR